MSRKRQPFLFSLENKEKWIVKRASQGEITSTIVMPEQDYQRVYNWYCFPKQILSGGGKPRAHAPGYMAIGKKQRALVERTERVSVKAHETARNTETQSYGRDHSQSLLVRDTLEVINQPAEWHAQWHGGTTVGNFLLGAFFLPVGLHTCIMCPTIQLRDF